MTEEIKEVGWNLAQYIIQEMSNLLQGASNNYINGNYMRAFSYLRAIRMRIAELTIEEHAAAVKKENRYALLSYRATGKGFAYTVESGIANFDIYKLYGEYNDLIFSYLKKYGYLVPPKEDRTNLNK